MQLIDVGTGSGILAIAAAKLGAASVLALDTDPQAIAVACGNVARNEVDDAIRLAVGSLPWEEGMHADCVVANISSQTVLALLPAIADALAPGGLAILCGFIEAAAEAVDAAARASSLVPLTTGAEGEWRCIVARRAASA
jgi:ribosomal protein L11 methyltransferase